jgi:hypothetical protein
MKISDRKQEIIDAAKGCIISNDLIFDLIIKLFPDIKIIKNLAWFTPHLCYENHVCDKFRIIFYEEGPIYDITLIEFYNNVYNCTYYSVFVDEL